MKSLFIVIFIIFLKANSGFGATTKANQKFILGDHTGNGGDVVVCEKEGVKSYRILDLYETTELHFLGLLTFNDSNLMDVVKEIFDGTQFAPIHKKMFEERAKNFMGRITWTERELPDLKDSYHTFIPRHCRVRQIAINSLNGSITINRTLWNSLDNLNKATLIAHELIYEDLVFSGFENSVTARLIVSHALADAPIGRNGQRLYDFLWEELGELPTSKIKEILRYSPLIKERAMREILKRGELDYETKQFILGLSETDQFMNFFRVFSYGFRDHDYSDFQYRYLKSGLPGFIARRNFDFRELRDFLGLTTNTLKDNSLEKQGPILKLVLQLYEVVALENLISPENSDPFFDFFRKFPFYFNDQKSLNTILGPTDFLFGDVTPKLLFSFLSKVNVHLNVSEVFLDKLWKKARKLGDSPYFQSWFTPHPDLFRFLLLKSYRVDEILPILKKYLVSSRSTDGEWNAPFNWFFREEAYIALAPIFQPELLEASLKIRDLASFETNLKYYYETFPSQLLPAHKKALLNYFYDKRGVLGEKALNLIVDEFGVRDNEIQNAYAYGLRFDRDYDWQRLRYLKRLDLFKDFTEFTHSVVFLEMRKRVTDEEYLLGLMSLYLDRPLSLELKDFLEYLKNDNREKVRLLALELLL